ncbi:MAG: UDP-N-acetylmuramoyl-L-alanyl-D-glutamate--2,6-diaminopimelate ligase [Candidatus Babeliaceae bacterium]|jgi:UDP-N-acetylmuramoyl-L-alanyl-D-glutamate--2,6-diaminopimelate ligase
MNNNLKIFPVACHTDNIGPRSTFVAINGVKEHGTAYIPLAITKGATKIVLEFNDHVITDASVEIIRVDNARKALAELSAQSYNYPARKLRIIAITGTKGKTTTSFLIEHLLRSAGYKTALLSTVYNKINNVIMPTTLTTRQPDYLHAFFNECVNAQVEYVIMEVAAQALSLYRVHGLQFDAVVMTNFSQEHAEFYPTMSEYFAAKASILSQLRDQAPLVINVDDAHIAPLARAYARVAPYSLNNIILINKPSGLDLVCVYRNQELCITCPALIGAFNGYNILAAIKIAEHFGVDAVTVQEALATFAGVPGRFDKYALPNGAQAVIDYAHNPSSFQAVLPTLKALTDHFIVVFGCGGERDSIKRPLMGEIAALYADLIIITTDNCRSEIAADIARDIMNGIPIEKQAHVIVELDREQAIKRAYTQSKSSSIIALLGKGPDEYQLIQGVKYPFSEKAILKSLV